MEKCDVEIIKAAIERMVKKVDDAELMRRILAQLDSAYKRQLNT